MPAHDLIHDAVKNALTKDGWTITADPFTLEFADEIVYADLAAEKTIAAEREGRKIAVEIKSFLGPSQMRDFEIAVGQYTIYRDYLGVLEPDREIFMAVSEPIYDDFFSRRGIDYVVQKNQLALVVVQIEREEIVKWTNARDTAP